MAGEIIVTTAAGDRADVPVFGQDKFKDGAGVVIEATDDFEVSGDLIAEVHGFEEAEDLV